MMQTDTPFPYFITGHREFIDLHGCVREALIGYNQSCRSSEEKKDFVLDGRLAVEHPDGFIDFPEKIPPKSSGAILKLYVDDMYSYSVFKAGEGSQDFITRRKKLKKVIFGIDSKCVRINHYQEIDSKKRFRVLREDTASLRGFGVVLRENAPYRSGKSGSILYVPAE